MELGQQRSGILMETSKQVNWRPSDDMMRHQVGGLWRVQASDWPMDCESEGHRSATYTLSQGSSLSPTPWEVATSHGLNSHAVQSAHDQEPEEEQRQKCGRRSILVGDRCIANEDNTRVGHKERDHMSAKDPNSSLRFSDRGQKFVRLMDNEPTRAGDLETQQPQRTSSPITTSTSDLPSKLAITKETQLPDSQSGLSPMSSSEVSTSSMGMEQPGAKNNERQLDKATVQRIYPPNHPLGNTKHLCSICGDRATGKHYGVFSCEGCKGFFKRTIRKDIVYVCRNEGHCLIDMRQRNRCQYCRYQKCLRQGMKREAVQEEKQRLRLRAAQAQAQMSGHQMDSRVESSTNSSPSANLNLLHQSYAQDQAASPSTMSLYPFGALQAPYLTSHAQETDEMQMSLSQGPSLNQFVDQMDCSPASRSTPSSTSASCGYPLTASQQPASYRTSVMRDFSSFYNSANQQQAGALSEEPIYSPASKLARIDELTLRWAAQVQIEQLVDWARGVPHFRSLLLDDQVTLLRSYWNELIIADIAFKSMDLVRCENHYGKRSLFIGRGLFINECQAGEIGLGNMFSRIIDELVLKMRDLRVDANELACLRAIILFNPETQGLKSSHPIEVCRGDVYTGLESYCRENYCDQPNRFGKLLLRLPALRSIGLKCDPSRRCDSKITSNNFVSTTNSTHNSSLTANVFLNGSNEQNPNIGQQQTNGINSPNLSSSNILGYQYKLLFYDICYELTPIDSFLRSNLTR